MATREAPQVIEAADEKVPHVESAHLEHSLKAGLSHDDASFLHEFSPEDHKKAYRKVDWMLMPMLMALYLIANLDRYVCLSDEFLPPPENRHFEAKAS